MYNILEISRTEETMLTFIKENYRTSLKLFINQMGMTVFGLIVLIAAKLLNNVVFHCAGVLAILMYMYLLYTAMWEKGSEDKIRIDAGRIKENKLYGLYVSLIANFLNILFGIIIVITSFFAENVAFCGDIYGAIKIIDTYINGMYMSLTYSVKTPFIYLIIVLPALLVSTVSYISGINGQRYIFPQSKKRK